MNRIKKYRGGLEIEISTRKPNEIRLFFIPELTALNPVNPVHPC